MSESTAVQGPSEQEIKELLDELDTSPETNLIGLLQDVQDRLRYLPPRALEQISKRTKKPLSRIYGVVSFYAQFYTQPRGRHTINCCRGTACHVKEAGTVLEAIERALGIKDGESTPDLKYCLETVACLGCCALAPVMTIDEQTFGRLTSQSVVKILQEYGQQAETEQGENS